MIGTANCRTAAAESIPPRPLPRLLCVDDEPNVLEGIRDRLHRSFDVRVAQSGREGLELLEREPDAFAIVISDMRMPAMPGDAFLREARTLAPDAVRLLLTGNADVDAAIRVVNEVELFRFLTKPCDDDELLRACAAALGHHRLLRAEQALLERTLRGTISALSETMALASPAAFGRGSRVRELVARLCETAGSDNSWEVEVAAMLAHIGAVTLPAETAERWYAGKTLTIDESMMVARIPRVTRQLLAPIPRLEGVLAILDAYRTNPEPGKALSIAAIPEPARILRIAVDYDALTSVGNDGERAIAIMRGRRIYDPYLLARLADALHLGTGAERAPEGKPRQVPLDQLAIGMTLANDVRTASGGLLVARGQVVSEQLIRRLANLGPGTICEPLLILEGSP